VNGSVGSSAGALHEQTVKRDENQDQPGDHDNVGAIQPDQDRHLVSKARGEPQPSTAQELPDLQVVPECLKALLVPLQDGAREHGQDHQAEHGDADEPVAFTRPFVGTGDEHPHQV
jgi:hypothetical protein